jgi:hypothetical protein
MTVLRTAFAVAGAMTISAACTWRTSKATRNPSSNVRCLLCMAVILVSKRKATLPQPPSKPDAGDTVHGRGYARAEPAGGRYWGMHT